MYIYIYIYIYIYADPWGLRRVQSEVRTVILKGRVPKYIIILNSFVLFFERECLEGELWTALCSWVQGSCGLS